jgi:hypothetical protein
MADFVLLNDKLGNLTAICPDCGSIINRIVSLSKIHEFDVKLKITFPRAWPHISESVEPSVKSDLK